jgi:hypothetical protein
VEAAAGYSNGTPADSGTHRGIMAKDKRTEAIEKYVSEFTREYMELSAQAEEQVEHTRTIGWQSLVKSFRASQQQACAELALQLETAAKLINQRGPDEGVIKSIGDVKKRADETYETIRHFEASVVSPIRLAAQRAGDLAARKRSESERLDANEPLIWNGIRNAVAAAINDLPRYAWNAEKWIVERLEPGVMVLEQKVDASVVLPSGATATVVEVKDADTMPDAISEYIDALNTLEEEDYANAVYDLLAGKSEADPDDESSLPLSIRTEIRDEITRLAKESGIELAQEPDEAYADDGFMTKAERKPKKPKKSKN